MLVHAETIRKFEEKLTGYCGVIGSDHAYIHQGRGFQYPCSFSLGNGAVKGCIIRTPLITSLNENHWRPTRATTSAAAVRVELYEAPTYTGGTPLTGIVNMNRSSTRTPETVLVDGTLSISNNGTLLSIDILGGSGSPARVAGGSGGQENEIYLDNATEYLLLFTNITTTTTIISANLFWYEEEKLQ